MGNVSRLTVAVVADGSFSGGKMQKAKYLGTAIVHPMTFETLLAHLRPALPLRTPARSATSTTTGITCRGDDGVGRRR